MLLGEANGKRWGTSPGPLPQSQSRQLAFPFWEAPRDLEQKLGHLVGALVALTVLVGIQGELLAALSGSVNAVGVAVGWALQRGLVLGFAC